MKKLKAWLPPEVIRIGRHITGYGSCFRGEFSTWEEAAAQTKGYDDSSILEKVLANTIAVRDGKAEFERDGVLFYRRDDRYPMLAALMRCAAENDGNLRVLDFGGGLGSAYFQHRHWFAGLKSIKWCVVEQEHFVEAGNKHLNDGKLFFTKSIEEAGKIGKFDIIIFSSVLQYIKDFSVVIGQAIMLEPAYILIDRTPVIEGDKDMICVQKQTRRIVSSSYTARLFSTISLLDAVGRRYKVISEFSALDDPMGGIMRTVNFRGFIFERLIKA